MQLGRYGDIINLLPLFYKDFQATGRKSHLIVSKDYADILDGVSYVEPHVFQGGAHDMESAVQFAGSFASTLRCSQVLGPPEMVKKFTYGPIGQNHAIAESYQKESWRALGRLKEWREQLPLVFDQRNSEREKQLVERYHNHRKKLVLVHAEGVSSPFPYKTLLLELVRLKYRRGYEVLDLSEVLAERLYDLLGLLERAYCLVAIDSAILHLAYACPDLPVAALIADRPLLWNGSVWRPNHISHVRYSDFPQRATEMLEAMDSIYSPGVWPVCRPISETSRIVHVWSGYELAEQSIATRHREVREAWLAQYAEKPQIWIRCPVEPGAVGRDSRTNFRDQRRFPYLLDVIRIAMQRARDNDVICLTRADTGFAPGPEFTEKVLEALNQPIYSHRWIWVNGARQYHPAIDLFAFTKGWAREHQEEIPDFIMGLDPYWHQAVGQLFARWGAKEMRFLVHRDAPRRLVKVPSAAAAKYVSKNEDLRLSLYKRLSITAMRPMVTEQHPTQMVNRRALSRAGYNGSLIRFNNRLLLAYRWHKDHSAATSLMMAELDAKFNVIANREIHAPGQSVEDPRLFILRGALFISFVNSTWPSEPTSVVQYARLVEGGVWKLEELHQPNLPGNEVGKGMQKNYVFFEHQERLFCVQHTCPDQVVYELRGPEPVGEWITKTPSWPWGDFRGGVFAPTLVDDGKRRLRFVHSRLDNEAPPAHWRYYVGACLCNVEPPFEIKQVSSEPVIYGSEQDDTTDMERAAINHRKPNVVFPAGVLEEEDGWLLSVGINDCGVGLVKLTAKDLNL